MAELLARIEELIELATMENPTTPPWYIRACVEDYIAREEKELASLKDQLPKEEPKGKLIVENTEEEHKEKSSVIVSEVEDETNQ